MKKKFKFTFKTKEEKEAEERLVKSLDKLKVKKQKIIDFYNCDNYYQLKLLIGKENIEKLLLTFVPKPSYIISNKKPKPLEIKSPELSSEHYLIKKYTFNQQSNCYERN